MNVYVNRGDLPLGSMSQAIRVLLVVLAVVPTPAALAAGAESPEAASPPPSPVQPAQTDWSPHAPYAQAGPSPPSRDVWYQAGRGADVMGAGQNVPEWRRQVAENDLWYQRFVASTDRDALDFLDVVGIDSGFAALGWKQGSARRGDEEYAPTWRSEDGATWHSAEPISLPDGARVSRLAMLDGDLFAIGMEGTHLAVWRSSEDGAWHRLRDRPSFAADPPGTGRRFGADISDVAAGHGRIVVSGSYWTLVADPEVEPVIWTSADGRRWRRSYQTLPRPDNGIHELAVTPSGFVGLVGTSQPSDCASGGESSLALTSTDGRSWRRATRRPFGCGVRAITYDTGSGRYYALAEAPDIDGSFVVVLASDDLRTWSEVYRPPRAWEGQPWSPSAWGIDSAGGYLVVVGDASWGGGRDGGTVWTLVSTDGDTWQLTADWPQGDGRFDEVQGWAVGEPRLVVATGAGVWYADLADLETEPA